MRFRRLATKLLAPAAGVLVFAIAVSADGGGNHQKKNTNFGVSGGNVNDRSKAFCCSGTLGALLRDTNGVNYILSNNHVLARSNAGVVGDDISQPGLIDVGCNVNLTNRVADLTAFADLKTSNVDAAIAQLRAGAMNTAGTIEDIGMISNTVATPAVGMPVAKSGRTTGYTESSITAVNATISVQYQQGCGGGKKFTVTYRNQIVIGGGGFSAGGDSGSAIVSGRSGDCRQPVGLLYAGSSTTTIANPAGEVLTKLGAASGKTLSFVGTTCTAASAGSVGPSSESIAQASGIVEQEADRLIHGPVFGVGVGADESNPEEAVLVLLVDKAHGNADFPAQIRGLRVKRVLTDPIEASPGCKTCTGDCAK